MTDEFDPFQGGTGQVLKGDFDAVITTAGFFKGAQSRNYNATLTLWIEEEGEEYERLYGVGGEWVSYDGGESLEHPGGDKALFNEKCAYFDLITHAMVSGAESVMRQRNREHDNHGPMHGEFWNDLAFHWDILKRPSSKRKEDGTWEDVEKERVLPTKFLGVSARGSTSPVAQTLAPAPALSVPTAQPSAAPTAGIHPEDLASIREAAQTHEYDSFVDAVLVLPSVSADGMMAKNPAVLEALSDESFYHALRDTGE